MAIDDARGKREWSVDELLRPLSQAPLQRQEVEPQLQAWAVALKRRRDCLVNHQGQPGPFLRWLCLLRLVCERWPAGDAAGIAAWRWRGPADGPAAQFPDPADLRDGLWAAYCRSPHHAGEDRVPADWLRGALYHAQEHNLWPAENYFDKDLKPLHHALQQAWDEIRQGDGLPPLTLKDLAQARPGSLDDCSLFDSLERLSKWIESDGQDICDDLSRLQVEHFVFDLASRRESLLDEVVKLLLTEGPGAAPVVNVYSDDDWTGLRALATAACCRAKELLPGVVRGRRPALIYLPLHRIQAADGGRRPSRRDIVDILLHSLGLAHTAGGHAVDPDAADLVALQHALTMRRVVLVIDGLEVASRPFGAVWDVLRNNDWTGFLRTLLQPSDSGLQHSRGCYRSRLLILSNQPLDDLAPWRLGPALELPPLNNPASASALLADLSTAGQRAIDLARRTQGLWPSPDVRPRSSLESLHTLYNLDAVTVGQLVQARGGLPRERELTLARCALDLRRDPLRDALGTSLLSPWLEARPARPCDVLGRTGSSSAVLQLLAVSISGLRRDTLQRALQRLASRHPVGLQLPPLDVMVRALREHDWVQRFCDGYRFLIEITADGDRLELPAVLRGFELDAGSASTEHASTGDAWLLDLRNERIRELFIAEMLSTPEGVQRFRAMNEVLAEEALAQATAQLRHLGDGPPSDAVAQRRLVQTIFHGLMSLDATELNEHDPRPDTQSLSTTGHALPPGNYRRFIYLYEFIYRRGLEQAPAWMLGRGLGRDDLRLALLTMFANPGWARRVLSLLHTRPASERSFESFGAFGTEPVQGFGRALQPAALYLHGAIGADLFNALLHACLRSGRHPHFAQRADLIAGQLTLLRPYRRESDSLGRNKRSFAKITIDALQAADQLEAVDKKCRDELAASGVRHPYDGLLHLGTALSTRDWDKKAFESEVLRPLAEELCQAESRQLQHVSDILFRVGERLATAADWKDDPAELLASQERYAHAYAVFWLGDRVRAGAATLDDSEISWPAVSARAMRYFIRVALKLAKLTALPAVDGRTPERRQAAAHAMEFFGHARARIDVYSRHLSRYPAERVQGLMLLAAAARVRASMAGSFSALISGEEQSALPLLQTSALYLHEAWPQLAALQFNRAIHKRLLLERIKTNGKLIARETGAASEHAAHLAARDRATLEHLSSSSPYWQRLLRHVGRGR